jgi:hypothetical protein
MLSVAVAVVVVESSETEVGLRVQPIFAVEDEMVQERSTVPLNPPVPLMVTVEAPVWPEEEMVTLVGFAATEYFGVFAYPGQLVTRL